MKSNIGGISLLVVCVLAFLSIHQQINMVVGKTCVATSANKFLCTNDAAKARAYTWKDAPNNNVDYQSLDLGIEQENQGSPEEKESVINVMEQMKHYFETEVLVKQEYNDVLGRW